MAAFAPEYSKLAGCKAAHAEACSGRLVGNAAVRETGCDAASVRQIDNALVRAFQDAAEGENLHSSHQ
ncbi:hypothetical protein MTY66_04600 [Mycolicibacterium sp. TY66]|nr:hypothetical protein MTY66_04600 [Mycolicibacterium sp. TY66]BCJ83504.1 hypothetical protein MTY81_48770 [Mycolicibacterium sp. TY81]